MECNWKSLDGSNENDCDGEMFDITKFGGRVTFRVCDFHYIKYNKALDKIAEMPPEEAESKLEELKNEV